MLLKLLLVILIAHALLKFVVFFFVPYTARRKMLDRQYGVKVSATTYSDMLLLGIVIVLLVLLFLSGNIEYVSFGVGLYAGMTLIQLYFHRFSKPLPPNEYPPETVSPIKMISYAIQANPEKPWRELIVIAILLVTILFGLLSRGLGA